MFIKVFQNHILSYYSRQYIDSMVTVEGGSKIDMEEEEDDASSTASDDNFIVEDNIFD